MKIPQNLNRNLSMSDVKPVGEPGDFRSTPKGNKENLEISLFEALIEHENEILEERIQQEKKRREKQLVINREAASFSEVSLDQYFSANKLPTKIISQALSKKAIELKKQEIEAGEKNRLAIIRREREEQAFLAEQKRRAEELELIKKKELAQQIELEEREKAEREEILKKAEEERIRMEETQQEESRKSEIHRIEAEKLRQKKLREAEIRRIETERLEREELAKAEKQRRAEIEATIKEKAEKERKLLKQKIKEEAVVRRTQRAEEVDRKLKEIKANLLAKPQKKNLFDLIKPTMAFSGACLAIFFTIFSLRFVSYGMQIKDQVMVKGVSVVSDLENVKDNFQDKNFSQVISNFQNIQKEINEINKDLDEMEGGLPDLIKKIPIISKYGSAKNLLESGEEIAEAMVLITEVVDEFSEIENPLNFEEETSLGEFFLTLEKKMVSAEEHLELASKKLEEVDESDIPEEYQEKVEQLKKTFPQALALLKEFNQKQTIFKDLLGFNGPRKYLFLFQNNHEMRATGGFIGSYGVMSVHDGNIKELFVDGIFNPDGQLSTRVVPPEPIQKISESWSTHDANWYPDFPTSAQKIAWFYEKTGGPTVDGIITLTPTVLEKLLEITGPIEMTEYGVTIDADNFIEATQFEVEVDYDKEENKPKKFIADLTPKILDRLFSKENLGDFPKTLKILSEALNEKHILIYSENSEIQDMVSGLGWSGEILETSKDYLMVVNSNVNGYKTDGVIDQEIEHEIEIEEDGSIIDTVTIKRIHNGGSTEYEWWNKVNANYMRVYVPLGSELIEAKGYTRETVESPVNYDKLGFKRDELVESIENSIEIDKETGTEIWQESGKTVFGNWVYVSPQEKVKVVYKYKLPFKVEVSREEDKLDNFSVLYQKQSGMNTSALETEINLFDDMEVFWEYPSELKTINDKIKYESNLEEDRFIGVVIK